MNAAASTNKACTSFVFIFILLPGFVPFEGEECVATAILVLSPHAYS